MLRTFFKLALASALTASLSLADDFLAKVSNGALSDSSAGVKKLTLDEAKQVVGGYLVGFADLGAREAAVYAVPRINAIDYGIDYGSEITYDRYGNFVPEKSGICSAGVTHCYMFKDTRTQYQQNVIRLRELMNIVGDPITTYLAYTTKINIIQTRTGAKQFVFSYGVGMVDAASGAFSRLPSTYLQTNFVAKDLAKNYKSFLERYVMYQYGGK